MEADRAWRYFDFDSNWDRFLPVWQSDEVQTVLENDVNAWSGASISAWRRGMPLWELADWRWEIRIEERVLRLEADLYGSSRSAFDSFKRTMRTTLNRNYRSEWEVREAYEEIVLGSLAKELAPKEGSIDSLYVDGAHDGYANALALVASKLFPGSEPQIVKRHGDDSVILAEEHIVFDLLDFYGWVHLKDESCDQNISASRTECLSSWTIQVIGPRTSATITTTFGLDPGEFGTENKTKNVIKTHITVSVSTIIRIS